MSVVYNPLTAKNQRDLTRNDDFITYKVWSRFIIRKLSRLFHFRKIMLQYSSERTHFKPPGLPWQSHCISFKLMGSNGMLIQGQFYNFLSCIWGERLQWERWFPVRTIRDWRTTTRKFNSLNLSFSTAENYTKLSFHMKSYRTMEPKYQSKVHLSSSM